MSQRNVLYHLFSAVRILLYPFALIYGAVVWLRNRLYDSGVYASVEFSIPVISVGNLSVGGTGKTPHVEYLINLLQHQYRLATMSRGYKRRTQGFILADEKANALRIGDEPMQYFMKYPGLVVSVAEERLTGIPALLQKRADVQAIILDDAYQHRSVKPGLNILITDYSKPFYEDHILPLGTLRESRKAYERADVIIVSKCPANMPGNAAEEMTKKIAPLENQKVFFSTINYGEPYNIFSQQTESLRGKNIILVCGIAKPQPLIAKLKETAADVHVLSYADHHYFVSKDLEEIQAAHNNWDIADKVIVTTEKDIARLHLHADKLSEWNIPMVVVPVKVSVLFNKGNDFDSIVLGYVANNVENHTYYDEKT